MTAKLSGRIILLLSQRHLTPPTFHTLIKTSHHPQLLPTTSDQHQKSILAMAITTGSMISAIARRQAAGCGLLRRCARPVAPFKPMLRPQNFRCFSVSGSRAWHTVEMSEPDLASLKVNQSRLMEDIHYTCSWGTGERWGT